jgi:hypothetical protein
MRRGLAVLLAVVFTAGCSSSYEPARSPRIVTVVEGGQPTFVKNGERIGGPAFGSGLADAVASNPEAERQATIGRNLVLGGFVLDLVGLGSVIGGTVVLAKQDATQEQPSTAGTALLLGGVAAALAGSVMILCGQPHIYDAVNIYNDSLEARALPAPTAPPAPAPALTAPPAPAAPAPAPPPAALGPRASLIAQSAPGVGY